MARRYGHPEEEDAMMQMLLAVLYVCEAHAVAPRQ